MKPVHVWMLLAAVAGTILEGCGMMGQVFRIDDSPPPPREVVVSTQEPVEVCPPAWWQRGEASVTMSPSSRTVMPRPSTGQSPRESMDGLMREMEAELQSHEEPGVATRTTEGVPQKKAAGFLVGIGASAESRESAEAQARLDIVKSFEVEISGHDTIQERESSDQGFEYSVESTVVERVDLSLTGLSIPKVGMCGNQWYALAWLDRAKAETAWRADMRWLDDEAKAFRRHIDRHKQNNDALALLLTQYRLTVALETVSQIQQRLPRLTGQSESGPLRASDVQDAKSAYESLLRSFQVKSSGDNQQAVEGPVLLEPFMIQVLAGEDPVVGVPVRFAVTRGKVEVPSDAETDEDGKAEVKGRYLRSTDDDAPAQVEAEVLLDHHVTKDYPVLKRLVQQQQERLTVRFQVRPPVYQLVEKSRELAGDANKLRSTIQAAREEGDVVQVMDALSRLHEVQREWDQVVERLQSRDYPVVEESDDLEASDDTLHELERLVSSFAFRSVRGDRQDAKLDLPLDDPLEVKLTAYLEEGNEVPVSGVPVLFSFDRGKGEVDYRVATDHEGHAHADVHRIEPAEGPNDTEAVITARLEVAEFGQSLPSSVRQRLDKYVDEFRINLPQGCTSSNTFDHQLYELACNLVRQVNSSIGKHTVVHGFVERESRRRFPLSDRIEEALGSGLALTGQLEVLSHPTSGNDLASRDPEVEVSGVYERNGENLLVQARLTRLSDDGMKAMEAIGETTIPREALPKTALSSLPSSHSAGRLLVPDPSDFATHDEWVKAFWDHHNPQPEFKTSIRPKKSLYHDKEHAAFEFKTERDCYLWVFAIDVEDNGALLLPNKLQPNLQHVSADAGSILIAGKNGFPISPPFGSERVKTVCTTDPIHIIAREHINDLPDKLPMFVFSRDNQRFHDVGETPKQRDVRPVDWSEAHTQFTTIPKGRQTTRGLDGLRKRGLISKEE